MQLILAPNERFLFQLSDALCNSNQIKQTQTADNGSETCMVGG